jgi:FtsK gamma domain protein
MTNIKENTKMNDYTTEKMIEKLKANRAQGMFSGDDETIQKFAETIKNDPIFLKILEFVLTEQNFSIAAIQKKFRLGYTKGSYYAEILEALGVISISLPRKVLIQSKDELN